MPGRRRRCASKHGAESIHRWSRAPRLGCSAALFDSGADQELWVSQYALVMLQPPLRIGVQHRVSDALYHARGQHQLRVLVHAHLNARPATRFDR